MKAILLFALKLVIAGGFAYFVGGISLRGCVAIVTLLAVVGSWGLKAVMRLILSAVDEALATHGTASAVIWSSLRPITVPFLMFPHKFGSKRIQMPDISAARTCFDSIGRFEIL
jgi:hypothetical protein